MNSAKRARIESRPENTNADGSDDDAAQSDEDNLDGGLQPDESLEKGEFDQ